MVHIVPCVKWQWHQRWINRGFQIKQWICNAAFASDNILVNQAKQRKCQEEINQSDKSPQLNSPLTDRRLSLR